jgi:hypothetical protein
MFFLLLGVDGKEFGGKGTAQCTGYILVTLLGALVFVGLVEVKGGDIGRK